ncbi:MAG: hypothetical protein IIZ92_15015, partial [Aquincola sp.]|nr:hypothetical protein [Aquincola sp.]
PGVRASLACWPGLTHLAAAQAALQGASEPQFGPLLTDHVQLVPQSVDVLDESLAAMLVSTWPATQFRLHANVRVLARHRSADLCTFARDLDWFQAAARVHRVLGADVYSAHAGLRRHATLIELFDNARRCADLFGCRLAIEGQYPIAGDNPHPFLVSSWAEYRSLLESSLPYALDLSHLNILAQRSGHRDDALVADLLASPACLEVHVSDNDGRADTHRVLVREPWWWPLVRFIQPGAVVFSEGNHARRFTERLRHESH